MARSACVQLWKQQLQSLSVHQSQLLRLIGTAASGAVFMDSKQVLPKLSTPFDRQAALQAMQDRRTEIQTNFRRWAIAKQLQIDEKTAQPIERPPVRSLWHAHMSFETAAVFMTTPNAACQCCLAHVLSVAVNCERSRSGSVTLHAESIDPAIEQPMA